jgi:hypothetical protein
MRKQNSIWSMIFWPLLLVIIAWGSQRWPSLHVQLRLKAAINRSRSSSVPFQTATGTATALPNGDIPKYWRVVNHWRHS